MATNRDRKRVGRRVTYNPTDAEAATGNGDAGDRWPATISARNADGSVNLLVTEADGGILAKTNVVLRGGAAKGFYDEAGGNAFV